MQDRKPLIAGNWKMFKTCAEAVETTRRLIELVGGISDTEVMIAPPYTALGSVAETLEGSQVLLGAQNLHWEKEGAYTGEISAPMLVSTACRYVIIGHSERRQYFGETDKTVNKKMGTAIRHGLIPIFCIGETEQERESDSTFSVLDKQLKKGLEGLFANDLQTLVVAYEPVWAIGTGKTATSDQAQEVHHFLRSLLSEFLGQTLAGSTRILYGGSVKPDNIADLMDRPDIDGALVGGASLNAETFSKIIKFKNS